MNYGRKWFSLVRTPNLKASDDAKYPLGYNPSIDGIRAIAALNVVLAHFRIPGIHDGRVGVDIFFVLSGYLITQILLKDALAPDCLGQFYWRRILRLMPALSVVCITLILLSGWYIASPVLRDEVLPSIFYIANWTRAFSLGIPSYMGTCWSLAVEEQFYLVWPLILLFFIRHNRRTPLIILSIILFLACISWRSWYALHGGLDDRIFNGSDTHCDGILLGCVSALAQKMRHGKVVSKAVAKIWPIAAVIIIYLMSWMEWNHITAVVTDFMAAVIILAVVHLRTSLLSRALALYPLVAIGRISYGLYLWHYPIWILMHNHFYTYMQTLVIGLPLSFVCASLSYRYVEQPMLRLRYRSNWRTEHMGLIAVRLSLIGMIATSGYFFKDDVTQAFFSEPLVIEAYDPHSLKAGGTFNVQPDGESWMWMRLSHGGPQKSHIRIGSRDLETNIQGKSISVLLPKDLREHVGKEDVILIDQDGNAITPPVTFEVTK